MRKKALHRVRVSQRPRAIKVARATVLVSSGADCPLQATQPARSAYSNELL
jgi:hypothetical protein